MSAAGRDTTHYRSVLLHVNSATCYFRCKTTLGGRGGVVQNIGMLCLVSLLGCGNRTIDSPQLGPTLERDGAERPARDP